MQKIIFSRLKDKGLIITVIICFLSMSLQLKESEAQSSIKEDCYCLAQSKGGSGIVYHSSENATLCMYLKSYMGSLWPVAWYLFDNGKGYMWKSMNVSPSFYRMIRDHGWRIENSRESQFRRDNLDSAWKSLNRMQEIIQSWSK